MLPNNRSTLRLSDIIRQSIQHWRQSLSQVAKFLGPLTVLKALYATLIAQMLGVNSNAPVSGSVVLLSLLIVFLMAAIEGCCFLAVCAKQHEKRLSSWQVMVLFTQRGLLYLACWGFSMMLGALGAMFFVIPGILLFAYTKYAKLIALFEGLSVMDAMKASMQLVGKQVLRVIAIDAFLMISGFIMLMLAQMITPAITNFFSIFIGDTALGVSVTNALGLFLTFLIVQIVVLPLSINAQLLQWHDLKQRWRIEHKKIADEQDEETLAC